MRGIVISPEVELIGDFGATVKSSNIDPINLRQYLLYWDKADFPLSTAIYFEDSPETMYLKEVGFLQRSVINLQFSGNFAEIFLKGQTEAFRENNMLQPGCWSIAQPNRKLILDAKSSILKETLEVDLYRCLPVPTLNVSLEDILKFKEQRKDELLEFRELVDNLYLETINSGDVERARIKNIELLQRKIVELDRVMNESKISRFLGSIKIEIDFTQALKNTLGAIITGKAFGFPLAISGAIGFTSSFIKLNSEFTLAPKELPADLKDFAYLYYAHKELT